MSKEIDQKVTKLVDEVFSTHNKEESDTDEIRMEDVKAFL